MVMDKNVFFLKNVVMIAAAGMGHRWLSSYPSVSCLLIMCEKKEI